jgi:hypothetical protein
VWAGAGFQASERQSVKRGAYAVARVSFLPRLHFNSAPQVSESSCREKLVAGLFDCVFHPQPVEQCALGLLLAGGEFDLAPNETGSPQIGPSSLVNEPTYGLLSFSSFADPAEAGNHCCRLLTAFVFANSPSLKLPRSSS